MTDWTPADGPMPALYLGHGAPPLLDDALWTAELAAWAASLPRPRAILIVSAHWETAPVSLSATGAATPLVYDFGGFAPKYYAMTYPTPDASALAALVTSMLPDTERVHQHAQPRARPRRVGAAQGHVPRGADIPVLQLSLPTSDPQRLLELGARLRPLRDHGVLVIGSGYLTHGLPFLRDWSPQAKPPGWSVDFDLWAAEALDRGDVDTLAAYRSQAPGMPYAHPTVEHYVPLFITLGAATDPTAPPQTTIDGYFFGLAKRSFQVA